MQREPKQYSLRTLLAVIAVSAAFLSWARMSGGLHAVVGSTLVILLVGIGGILVLLGADAFGCSLAAGSIVALLLVGPVSGVLAEELHGYLLLGCAVSLWLPWAYVAVKRKGVWRLLQAAAGLTWGFLAAISTLVSVQNQRVSVDWPVMVPTLLLMPFLAFLPVLPFWGFRHLLRMNGPRQSPEFRLWTSLLLPLLFLFMILLGTLVGWLPGKPTAPPGDYDLTGEVALSQQPAHVGDTIRFSVSVRNLGTSTIPPRTYDWEFYVERKLVAFDRAPATLGQGLAVGYPNYCAFEAETPGRYSYRLVLDPYDSLQEVDETNNVIVGVFEVLP